ncbi:EAL domain-containing protein [Roseateles sp. DAIF2]|uniref:bifunctional diguanylate cyclase/phosphodiesterase n=1 Tax=Roseateles sp. DAIF2 TaxID=2714952 RepID=UPI0018A30362|nr:EAL domain-containing protein [Roseateles sp. DAIF2]QPF72102.1 EAL domain-containing protein [Roseateles sp. DAIF2]
MRQILAPVLLVLLAIALLLGLSARQQQQRSEQQQGNEIRRQAQSLWLRLADDEARRLRWLAQQARENPALQRAMRAGDRAALLLAARGEYGAMRRESGISHVAFITPQQRTLLQLLDPEAGGGELVLRPVLAEAARLDAPAEGWEMASTGVPVLRHVSPWRVDGQLIGYLELGTELGWFARRLGDLLSLEVVAAVHKRHGKERDFARGKQLLGLAGQWDEHAQLALLHNSLPALPSGLLEPWQELAGGGEDPGVLELTGDRRDERSWLASLMTVHDRQGRALASLALLDDISASRAAATRRWGWIGGLCGVLGLALFAGLYWRVRHVARTLSRADRALRANEQRFHDFATAAGDWWFWELDERLRFSYVSPNVEHVTGRAPASLLGRTTCELLPEHESDPAWAAHLQDLERRRPIRQFEFDLSLPDGERRWIQISGLPLFDEDGAFQGYRGTGSNISARKATELELRLAATAFEAQEGMFITDAERRILRVNKAFSLITGFSAEEALGNTPRLLSSGRYAPEYIEEIAALVARQGRWQGEILSRRKNGEIYPQWLTLSAVRDAQGELSHCVGLFSDITERKAAEAEIERLAFYDPLTGLPNRRLLLDRLQRALAAAQRGQRHGALLLIDLDNFKTLNDTQGHDLGDLLLKQVAGRLLPCVRKSDTVARLGGDEFVIILDELSEAGPCAAAEAEAVGVKLLKKLTQPYELPGLEHHSTASIGIALFGPGSLGLDDVMKQADLAMYQSKAAGRNAIRFFDPAMQSAASERARLDAEIRRGLQRGEFRLFYQAQVDEHGALTGAEALLRWQHPQRGLVPPLEFIAAAEQSGLILPLGQWVLDEACRQLAEWSVQPDMARLNLSINVSARQFQQADFVTQVQRALDRSGAPSQRLKLELTESLLMEDVEGVIAKMNALQACGVGFALDDFGIGYSSLNYLRRLPLEQLKIDQSFVRNVLTEKHDAAIVRTIVALAQSLGLEVLAEGVETEAQRDFLLSQGCAAHQGFLFSQPLPLGEFERLPASARSAP